MAKRLTDTAANQLIRLDTDWFSDFSYQYMEVHGYPIQLWHINTLQNG